MDSPAWPAAEAGTACLALRTVVVTAADHNQFSLLRHMLATLRAVPDGSALPVVCLDLGLESADLDWLAGAGVEARAPRHRFDLPPHPAWQDGYLAQPFLRETLPGWDVYLWIDADIWFQDGRAIAAFLAGAAQSGFAIAHERCPDYRMQPWLQAWMAKHFVRGFGLVPGLWLATRAHLNSGLFALRADAPLWEPWTEAFAAAIRRTGDATPHGQFAMNRLVHGRLPGAARLPATLLEPWANWICDRGMPMWNDEACAFCEPRAPWRILSALHLAGPGKRETYRIRRTGGGEFLTRLLPGASPETPVLDGR